LLAGVLLTASLLEPSTARPEGARIPASERIPEGFGTLPERLEDWSPRELRRLPGIGETRALAITQARFERGLCTGPEALDPVPGIGPRTVEAIRAWLAQRGRE